MINFEKLFQKDDEIFVAYSHFFQSLIILFSLYITSILDKNIIFDIFKIDLFTSSKYFLFTISVFLSHLMIFYFVKNHKNYVKTFYYFIYYDLKNILTVYLILVIFFNFFEKKHFDYLWFFNSLIFIVINLFLLKILNNKIYRFLIINNIIQRNIFLIGKFNTIKKFIDIYKNKNKKSLIKCCIITDKHNLDYFNELKIPVFSYDKNFFDILNYHYIGQIWFEIDEDFFVDSKINIEDLLKLPFDIKLFCKANSRNLIKLVTKQFNLTSSNEKKQNYFFYSINNSRFNGLPLLLKFIFDKIFSIIILILTGPIILIAILLILIEDGFPLIFTQTRTGWDGRKFKIYKLRTLKKENFDKTIQVMPNDKRLLFFGKFIRRFSIDELPQIFNVIQGDMSLVGPRPHMIEHSKKYSNVIKNFLTRHKCNPGITGWAQIHGFRGATPNDDLMKKRMEYDIWYLKNWSLGLDFLIMFKTIFAILKYKVD